MGVVNPSHLRAQMLTLCSCEHARNSTMAPRNSMRTKTHFMKKGKFWSKIRPKWPIPRGSYSKPMGRRALNQDNM